MSIQVQHRRGTKAENDAFTGAAGELIFQTDGKRGVMHDGTRAGGYPFPSFADVIAHYFDSATASGTDTLTLTLPYAPAAYAAYQEILFKPANNNTGAVTINVNSLGAKDIKKVDSSGSLVALAANDLVANIPVKCIYDGTRFIAQLRGGSTVDVQTFTGSGTWTKPGSGTVAIVQLWAGGGSGGKGSTNAGAGGGGGAFIQTIVPLSLLGSTETVTIGAGGVAQTSANTAGNVGGTSTFGSWLSVYGGGGGSGNTGGGGGGGGQLSAGITGTTTAIAIAADIASLLKEFYGQSTAQSNGGQPWGGYRAIGTTSLLNAGDSYAGGGGGGDEIATFGTGGSSVLGGGGGGGSGSSTVIGGTGGSSICGGGGGGGGAEDSSPGAGSGGTSKFGGNGGAGAYDANNATAGSQPAGGGGGSESGTSGAGGAGKCIVYVI